MTVVDELVFCVLELVESEPFPLIFVEDWSLRQHDPTTDEVFV